MKNPEESRLKHLVKRRRKSYPCKSNLRTRSPVLECIRVAFPVFVSLTVPNVPFAGEKNTLETITCAAGGTALGTLESSVEGNLLLIRQRDVSRERSAARCRRAAWTTVTVIENHQLTMEPPAMRSPFPEMMKLARAASVVQLDRSQRDPLFGRNRYW